MRNLLFVVAISWLSTHATQAQNLVLNPSFEDHNTCENGRDKALFDAVNWMVDGNPEYYNTCTNVFGMNTYSEFSTVPLNYTGYQYPHTGNAYGAITAFVDNTNNLWSEYLIANFSAPLTKDSVYRVNFWLSRGDFSGYYCKKLSACLSDTLVYDTIGVIDASYYTPQINNGAMSLNDTLNWVSICGTYRAKGGEKYLLIGNFDAEYPNNSVQQFATTTHWYAPFLDGIAYYYIDDVSVEKVLVVDYSLDIGKDTLICAAPPYNISLNAYKDYFVSYLWSTGETTAAIVASQPGIYWVQGDLGGCYLFDMITITHPTVAPIELGDDLSLCADEFPITLSAPSNYNTYNWSNGATTLSINIEQGGTYVAVANYICGTSIDTVMIEKLYPPTDILMIGDDRYNCENQQLTIVTLGISATLPNYLWSNGATTPTISVSEPDTYWLRSDFACGSLIDSITLRGCPPNYDYSILVPSAFSPNNDGVNDEIVTFFHNITFLEWGIYDRWGRQVFEAENAEQAWDGKYQGSQLPIGVYMYKIEYLTPVLEEKKVKYGNITLIR